MLGAGLHRPVARSTMFSEPSGKSASLYSYAEIYSHRAISPENATDQSAYGATRPGGSHLDDGLSGRSGRKLSTSSIVG